MEHACTKTTIFSTLFLIAQPFEEISAIKRNHLRNWQLHFCPCLQVFWPAPRGGCSCCPRFEECLLLAAWFIVPWSFVAMHCVKFQCLFFNDLLPTEVSSLVVWPKQWHMWPRYTLTLEFTFPLSWVLCLTFTLSISSICHHFSLCSHVQGGWLKSCGPSTSKLYITAVKGTSSCLQMVFLPLHSAIIFFLNIWENSFLLPAVHSVWHQYTPCHQTAHWLVVTFK